MTLLEIRCCGYCSLEPIATVVSRRQEIPLQNLPPSLAQFRTKLALALSGVPSRKANVHHDTGREEVDTVGVRAGAKP